VSEQLIEKGLLSENALAWGEASPANSMLYRQATLLNRFGGDIVRHTLANNAVQVGGPVQPLIYNTRAHQSIPLSR
jgi:transposase